LEVTNGEKFRGAAKKQPATALCAAKSIRDCAARTLPTRKVSDSRLSESCEKKERVYIMKMYKFMSVILGAAFIVAGFAMVSVRGNQDQFDAAATYKSKCVVCHGAAADKKFDTSIADAELVQIVLKGKKAEKPPHMPGYEDKGIDEEKAKALVALMKSLKQ
jgi:hypothetical protein